LVTTCVAMVQEFFYTPKLNLTEKNKMDKLKLNFQLLRNT
jgi:hypothetical protein